MTDIDLMHDAAGIVGKWPTWERHKGYDYDYLLVPDPTDPGGDARVAWNPLRFETDAFMIVKAIIARGLQFRLYGPFSGLVITGTVHLEPLTAPLWCAVIYQNQPDTPSFIASDLECARAITIACLKAVGVNTE